MSALSEAWIETQKGRFYINTPAFDIEVIAHALGQLTRYNGHGGFFYSVAEHSVLVSDLMETLKLGDPLEGLLHDGTEAYLSDVPRPFKELLGNWNELDHDLELKLRDHFAIGPKTTGCKDADTIALFIEADALLPSRGHDFIDGIGRPDLFEQAQVMLDRGWGIKGHEPVMAASLFLELYEILQRRIY